MITDMMLFMLGSFGVMGFKGRHGLGFWTGKNREDETHNPRKTGDEGIIRTVEIWDIKKKSGTAKIRGGFTPSLSHPQLRYSLGRGYLQIFLHYPQGFQDPWVSIPTGVTSAAGRIPVSVG
jgi:hypothetical protein